ncbi:RsbRD N-terminal domain-containing protein [Desulfomicrobium orale]|uniref:RsbT co-antagonist protein RsbRD N-terminal domain-containing protein n=1 Tax=Desulfomicrobium orale DSM 12838 TaxID=888061 RepID=A0A0X8JQA0_9BACT|nr:RsbRD N-terminal domain-containing protein [Desulfomicrobium orale]AMD92934.1 hypothetical protein AXF15_07330 [Desulfomicrobium orale DSM 12838]
MNLHEFLQEHHKQICVQWTEAVIRTYPEEGAKFFSAPSSQFANPVGHTFQANIERMFLTLARGLDVTECTKELDGILRIRAVQGFTPSAALCFLPALKEIVYREISRAYPQENMTEALHDWNVVVDRLTMLGFDIYMGCREVLWKQKANQLYDRTHKLLEKSNLLKREEVSR